MRFMNYTAKVVKMRRDLMKRLDVYVWTEGKLHPVGQTEAEISEVYIDIIARQCVEMFTTFHVVRLMDYDDYITAEHSRFGGMLVRGTPEQWEALGRTIELQLMVTEFHELIHQFDPTASEESVEEMAVRCVRYVNSDLPEPTERVP